jgi:hypothetical protein
VSAEGEPGPVGSISFVAEDVPSTTAVDIDKELDLAVERESRIASAPEQPPDKDSKPKAGPPKLDEWQDFFSRILIRSATDWYINWAFRGVDEDMLSPREVERINLTKEERDRIAKPFSEVANKSTFMRKHGRAIIALSDSWDSIIALGAWYNRVTRIARKYQTKQPRTVHAHVSAGQSTSGTANGSPVNGQGNYQQPYTGPFGTGAG